MERTVYTDTASVEDITTWVAEQAVESLPNGFRLKIGDEQDKIDRTRITKYRQRRLFYYKVPKIIMKWSKLRNWLYSIANKKAVDFYEDLQAECLFLENDNQDTVLIYPDNVLKFVNSFEERYVPIEKIVKDLVKHEARHAAQFLALRALNINPSMALTFESMDFKYGEGPLEKDAFYLQYIGIEERPVHEVAAEVKRLLTKKGWI